MVSLFAQLPRLISQNNKKDLSNTLVRFAVGWVIADKIDFPNKATVTS
jgi:hypothetical protein